MSIASARIPTPISNSPKLPFNSLEKENGHFRSLEFIAFPGTRFECLEELPNGVVRVLTSEYVSSTPLYVDRRFLTFGEAAERKKTLPSPAQILAWIKSCVDSRYFWGGNWNQGIPEMVEFYPALKEIDQDDALCRGIDCSGILYQATNGITPRNTSQLVAYGEELKIQHLPLEEMQQQLRPLDLMVWRGHVIIVLDADHFIESRENKGVVISDFKTRYKEAVEKLQGKPFYFRRWCQSALQ